MPIEITMPRLSDTMEEGTLVKWRVNVGDKVAAGDHLADVETDKATMELQAFDDGTVARIDVEEGQTVPVGNAILVLAEEGESVDDAAASSSAAQAQPEAKAEAAEAPAQAEAEAAKPAAAPSQVGDEGRIRVSPLARKIAEEQGLDLSRITGSGPDGRIIKRDVLQAAEAGAAAAAPVEAVQPSQQPTPQMISTTLEAKRVELTNMRKTIAKRLIESKTQIPHFTVSLGVNMDPLMDLRKTLNAQLESQGIKLSVNDFIVRATALALVQNPIVNSSWAGDTIQQHGTVNVGVAVALPAERGSGLVVPVLRDVQNMGLRTISEQTRRLATKAREQGLSVEEMSDGTFTISNLGMFGVDHFEAIINPPQAAILAVGGANAKAVVRDGQIVIGHEMTATLSADHRVIDGAVAAEFLQTLKTMLENPAGLLV